jgi:hypothetical protein
MGHPAKHSQSRTNSTPTVCRLIICWYLVRCSDCVYALVCRLLFSVARNAPWLLRIPVGKRPCGSFSQILRESRQSLAAFVFSLSQKPYRPQHPSSHRPLPRPLLSSPSRARSHPAFVSPITGTPLEQPLQHPRRIICAKPPPHYRFQVLPYANQNTTASGFIPPEPRHLSRTPTRLLQPYNLTCRTLYFLNPSQSPSSLRERYNCHHGERL